MYKIIQFSNGEKQKIADEFTDKEILEACKIKGLEVVSINRVALVEKENESKKDLYFKVIWGFDDERVTDITQDELAKALYAMSTKSKVYIGDVLLDGKYIIAIKENYQKYMGWNTTHQLDSDDWCELRDKGIDKLFAGKLYEAKIEVQNMIANRDISKLKNNQKQLN